MTNLLPKTTTQNILYGVGAVLFTMLLAGIGSLVEQLPGNAPILWRPILLDMLKAVIPLLIAFGAGWNLPRPTKEGVANLSSMLGTKKTEEVLQTAVDNGEHMTPVDYAGQRYQVDIHDLASAVIDESERRKNASTKPFGQITSDGGAIPRT